MEHNAYKIKLNNNIIWIDCPSTFDKEMEKFHINLFTHHHFIAAANLYKNYFSSELWIHENDTNNYIANKYDFDKTFNSKFSLNDIDGLPINGHTLGFTTYIFDNFLFICDYIFIKSSNVKFNPYGPYQDTLEGGKQLKKIIGKRKITFVCGYNYIMEWDEWNERFLNLLKRS